MCEKGEKKYPGVVGEWCGMVVQVQGRWAVRFSLSQILKLLRTGSKSGFVSRTCEIPIQIFFRNVLGCMGALWAVWQDQLGSVGI